MLHPQDQQIGLLFEHTNDQVLSLRERETDTIVSGRQLKGNASANKEWLIPCLRGAQQEQRQCSLAVEITKPVGLSVLSKLMKS